MILRDLRAINVVSSKVNMAALLTVSRKNIASCMVKITYFVTETLNKSTSRVHYIFMSKLEKEYGMPQKKYISLVQMLVLYTIS